MTHAMITQNFKIIQKSVFGRTLDWSPKWACRDGLPEGNLRAIINRHHFESTMFQDKRNKAVV
jgi:hypothetical protein